MCTKEQNENAENPLSQREKLQQKYKHEYNNAKEAINMCDLLFGNPSKGSCSVEYQRLYKTAVEKLSSSDINIANFFRSDDINYLLDAIHQCKYAKEDAHKSRIQYYLHKIRLIEKRFGAEIISRCLKQYESYLRTIQNFNKGSYEDDDPNEICRTFENMYEDYENHCDVFSDAFKKERKNFILIELTLVVTVIGVIIGILLDFLRNKDYSNCKDRNAN